MEHYALIEPNPLAERLARFDVFAREVYSPPDPGCRTGWQQKTRSSAKGPHPNIEKQLYLLGNPSWSRKSSDAFASADMELIDRGKIHRQLRLPGALPSEASPSRIASVRLPCV